MAVDREEYTVTFKHGELVLCTANGVGLTNFEKELDGHDTLRETIAAINSAIQVVRISIRQKNLPDNTLKLCDVVVVKSFDGTSKTYSDIEIDKMKDDLAELTKFDVRPTSKLSVYRAGGISGGLIGKPTNVSLSILSENDFTRVKEITDLLQRPSAKAKLVYADGIGDFGFHVKAGKQNARSQDMQYIFKGGPWSKTPIIVLELRKILEEAIKLDEEAKLELKAHVSSNVLASGGILNELKAVAEVVRNVTGMIVETGSLVAGNSGDGNLGYCETDALQKLPSIPTELARSAAELICKRLGQLEQTFPKFCFMFSEPTMLDTAAVVLTNSVCNTLPDQMQLEHTLAKIKIDHRGQFTLHLGSDTTYSGNGNDPEAVAQIPQRIITALPQWLVVTNG